jgi:methyl coenzyme M reductase gamma subunit
VCKLHVFYVSSVLHGLYFLARINYMAYSETPMRGTDMGKLSGRRILDVLNRHESAVAAMTAATVTAVACIAISRKSGNCLVEFIKENGLYEKYLATFDE